MSIELMWFEQYGLDRYVTLVEAIASTVFPEADELEFAKLVSSKFLPKRDGWDKKLLKNLLGDLALLQVAAYQEEDQPVVLLNKAIDFPWGEEAFAEERRAALIQILVTAGVIKDDSNREAVQSDLDATVITQAHRSTDEPVIAEEQVNEPPVSTTDETLSRAYVVITTENTQKLRLDRKTPALVKKGKASSQSAVDSASPPVVDVQPDEPAAVEANPPVDVPTGTAPSIPTKTTQPPTGSIETTQTRSQSQRWGPGNGLPQRKNTVPNSETARESQSMTPVQPPTPKADAPSGSETPPSKPNASELPNRSRQPTGYSTEPHKPLKKRIPTSSPDVPPPKSAHRPSGSRIPRPGETGAASTSISDSGSEMDNDRVEAVLTRLFEERDLMTVSVQTAELYARAILEYTEKLRAAGLEDDPAIGVRLPELLAQLHKRIEQAEQNDDFS